LRTSIGIQQKRCQLLATFAEKGRYWMPKRD
jgi:hypothetical protein